MQRPDHDYPRPLLVRPHWHSLDGRAGFRYDDDDLGVAERWFEHPELIADEILLPYPPESSLSGIGDTSPHSVLWYRLTIDHEALQAAAHEEGRRLLVHFGGVDHSCKVWCNGALVGSHEGGSVAFAVDVTDHLHAEDNHLVVRALDEPNDVTVPRGKQDWATHPHSIWYHRTSGIWKSVWMESVSPARVEALHWASDVGAGQVEVELRVTTPAVGLNAEVTLSLNDVELASARLVLKEKTIRARIPVAGLANAQDLPNFLWSPESPTLLDAEVTLRDSSAVEVDTVRSYVGLRTARVDRDWFVLNGFPYYVRGVLAQGYWPDSHLAATPLQLADEVRLIKSLGFNAVRVHQKVEDERFFYWADRLGLLVWAEQPSPFQFEPTRAAANLGEWADAVEQMRSHPSIVTWVPVNESWGVQHVSSRRDQASLVHAYAALTRVLDPTRPVVSNDGWEHGDSDIWTVHDYGQDGPALKARYDSQAAVVALLSGAGPFGKVMTLHPAPTARDKPLVLSEFGGVTYSVSERAGNSWGYQLSSTSGEFRASLESLFGAVRSIPKLAGFFYTQLTDTEQEANGLCDARRLPKLPAGLIRSVVMGDCSHPGERPHWETLDGLDPNIRPIELVTAAQQDG